MLSDTHITEIQELVAPIALLEQYPTTEEDSAFVKESRAYVEDILQGRDMRMLVVVGPCSIHDFDLALEYADRLVAMRQDFPNLYLVMRVYFEKPRTRKGWKGFIYDPHLDDSFQIGEGLALARRLLLELVKRRIPVGTEFLDTISPQYFADLVTWGAIGARTSESQIHRQLASGLSMPVGFKNLTSGDIDKAIDGIVSASVGHNFLGVNLHGQASHVRTQGNPFCHLILRGGDEPNYNEASLRRVSESLEKEGLTTGFLVDCSHGNSKKQYLRQILVALHMRRIHTERLYPLRGIMLESNLEAGNQALSFPLKRGVSITDACLSIGSTKELLTLLNDRTHVECTTVPQIRSYLRSLDAKIYTCLQGNANLSILHIPSRFHYEEDDELMRLCTPYAGLTDSLLTLCSTRLSFANRLAEIKFAANPFGFLQSDPLVLLTDRAVEREITELFPDPLFLGLIDLSKRIQLRCLRDLCASFRTGYLFGAGSFSGEAVGRLGGVHVAYPDRPALFRALEEGSVDAILLPTYNSLLGSIFTVDTRTMTMQGAIEHPIRLCLYGNRPVLSGGGPFAADTLYIESHIRRECQAFLSASVHVGVVREVDSSREGCLSMIRDAGPAFTVASEKNASAYMVPLAENLVEHNITTFSFLMPKMPRRPTFPSIDACIDAHCC